MDNAAGLTGCFCACWVALVAIDCPGDAASAAITSHILGLLMAAGDTRQCIKIMSEGTYGASYFDNVISLTTSCMRAR